MTGSPTRPTFRPGNPSSTKLQELDDAFGVDVIRCCPRSQIVEMDRMLNLILALDKDIIAVIDENRQKILASLKATVREKKSPDTEIRWAIAANI